MISFTFNTITRDINQDNLYDIFRQTVIDKPVDRLIDYVREEEEARVDKICLRLYQNTAYIEEFMILNNIVNPWSIKSGDEIVYINSLNILRETLKEETEQQTNTKTKKDTRIDPTRQKGVPPTIKPADFEQIIIDKKNQTIKLNTKLS